MERRKVLALLSGGAIGGTGLAQGTGRNPAKDDIVLGQTADFSASRSVISKAYAEGAALHFEEVNAAGGIGGRKIKVVQLDDGYDVKRAQANARLLVDEHKAFALVHLVGTAIVENVLPFVSDSGVPMIHALTGADQVRPPAKLVREAFFLRANYGREISRIVSQLKTVGIDRLGLLHEDEPFGHGIRDAVHAAVAEQKLALAATGVLPPNKPTDAAVAPAVKNLVKAAPKALIIGSAGPVVEKFIRAYHLAGGRTQFYCLSVSNVERLSRELGVLSHGIVITQVMPSVRSSNLQVVRDYRALMNKRGRPGGTFGLEGYISALMIVQALKEAAPQLSRSRFIAEMEKQTQVGGFPVKYRDPRQGSPFVELAMISADGKTVQ